MKVSWQEVNQVFDRLIQGEDSREKTAFWASQRMFANDHDNLEFFPPRDKNLIWDAIKYLTGVDLKDLDGSYLHSVENFMEFRESLRISSLE